ncbi:uncharacterized protein LOC126316435 [Schistocerca gregaria]|uniref:uncharacterized protein LOC126316435 n=1 Tax=Schistocerca gregaria TaxID=7010 RepID=UPI00211EDF8C|nr:uncharacterized protein LOC126316435 [Schistocerca gregaria]
MNSSIYKRLALINWNSCKLFRRDAREFYDTVTKPGQEPYSGRAWRMSELRLKSFSDLHKLWFVLLKERNMLLTERLRSRSIRTERFRYPMRLKKTRLSMARIKVVLAERSKVYTEAKHQVLMMYQQQKKKLLQEKREQLIKQFEALEARKEGMANTKNEPLKEQTKDVPTGQDGSSPQMVREWPTKHTL